MPMRHQRPHQPHHSRIYPSLKKVLLVCVILFSFCLPQAHAQLEALKDLYQRAITAYENQQYDQAITLFQQIIKVVPTFAPAYNGMALANQAASGDEDKTIEYLKTAIKYDPKMSLACDNLGRIYYARGDVDQAIEYFEKAVEIDPTLTGAVLDLAWINLLVKAKPKAAIKYFKMGLVTSQDPKIYYGLGQAYFASNQRVEAMDMVTRLYDMQQDDFASRLENSLRENAKVDTQSEADVSNLVTRPPGLGPLTPTSDQPTGTQVRLRGKLSDY